MHSEDALSTQAPGWRFMSSKQSKWKFIALLGFLALLVGAFSVDRKNYSQFLRSQLTAALTNPDWWITLGDTELRFIGVNASEVQLTSRHAPLAFAFGPTAVSLHLGRLFLLQRDIGFESSAYQGDLRGNLRHSIISGNDSFEINLHQIALAAHPQLLGLGISDGKLTVQAEGKFGAAPDLRGTLSLRDGKIPTAIVLQPELTRAQFPITIPAVSDLNIDLDLESADDTTALRKLRITSSLFSLSGNGEVKNDSNPTLNAQLSLSFTEAGKQAVAGMLPLICSGKFDPNRSEMPLLLDGPLQRVHCRIKG